MSDTPETDAAIALASDPDGAREVCDLCESMERQLNAAYDAIRKIAVTSHSNSETVRWNAIEDAERILPENANSEIEENQQGRCIASEATDCSLSERLEQLVDQWERRTISADKLTNDSAGAGDWTKNTRCKAKAETIRAMTMELERAIRDANKDPLSI